MAQKVSVLLVDDLDGSEAVDTVTFGLDGVSYEIDLSTDNAQRLRNTLADYVAAARKQGNGGRRRQSAASRSGSGGGRSERQSAAGGGQGGVDTNKVREWARANGHVVADRGRIRSDIIQAYTEANA